MRIWPGRPYPLGATWDGRGVNFALYSENATKVELCLFDSVADKKESERIELPEHTDMVWHVYLPDARPPKTPSHRTLIYELHVKGFTKLNEEVPEEFRGTYAGLSSEPAIRYLRELGITAVELLPVHLHADDRTLLDKKLVNYWGYNTLSFFAPEPRYASAQHPSEVIQEFKTMVRNLHDAGIEVILDVVYNHTAEGNQMGPTVSFRGIDNASYYRLSPEDPRYYMDFTGCGNTLHMRNPRVLQFIMDSLRYWVLNMRIDGFRFDLASTLARELHEVDKLGAFFDIIHQDPVLSQVKL